MAEYESDATNEGNLIIYVRLGMLMSLNHPKEGRKGVNVRVQFLNHHRDICPLPPMRQYTSPSVRPPILKGDCGIFGRRERREVCAFNVYDILFTISAHEQRRSIFIPLLWRYRKIEKQQSQDGEVFNK